MAFPCWFSGAQMALLLWESQACFSCSSVSNTISDNDLCSCQQTNQSSQSLSAQTWQRATSLAPYQWTSCQMQNLQTSLTDTVLCSLRAADRRAIWLCGKQTACWGVYDLYLTVVHQKSVPWSHTSSQSKCSLHKNLAQATKLREAIKPLKQ